MYSFLYCCFGKKKRADATHAAVISSLLGILAVAACSIIADPSVQQDWDYQKFNAFETFADVPNREYVAALPETLRQQCAPDWEDHPPESTIATTDVPWNMNTTCRNTFPASPGTTAPTREQVVQACTGPNWTPDENFIAIGISGGGTKSAVFATQAMFALDQWGLLDQVDMISSVSGGSFASALYALSCDAGESAEFCDQVKDARLRWPKWHQGDGTACGETAAGDPRCDQWERIGDRAKADLLWPFATRRLDPGDQYMRASSHRTSSGVLADTIDWRILSRPDALIAFPTSPGVFSVGAKEAVLKLNNRWPGPGLLWYAPGPDGVHKLRFRDLNPRRPALVLNATNVSTDRQYLEIEAGLPPSQKLLVDPRDQTHFAFTDHYFEKMLHADLASYPVASAVAASAAFPAAVDDVTVGRFMRPGSYGNVCGIDYLHLTDGGVLDNQGLTAIRLSLEKVFKHPDPGGSSSAIGTPAEPVAAVHRPRRVLAVIVDSSLTQIDGLSRNDPLPIGLDAAISPVRVFGIDRATSLLISANTVQHDARLRDYFTTNVRNACPPDAGPEKGDQAATCAGRLRIGFESMGGMDGYDGVLVGDRYLRCDDPQAKAYLDADPRTLAPVDAADRARQQRQCEVMAVLRTPEAKERLGLGSYHPQCYLEAVRTAATSYSIGADMAICLQHAARWAVAMKMVELCADRQFGGDPDLRTQGRLPVGVDCPLPLHSLPPLPAECQYAQIVNKRAWSDMPRQTAHCACTDPYHCRPEDLLTGEPIGENVGQGDDGDFRTGSRE